jgi:hypothetical protein
MTDDTEMLPVPEAVAQEIAAEMRGDVLQPLDPEEAARRTRYWAELHAAEELDRAIGEWERQQALEERQRLQAEQEAYAAHVRHIDSQRQAAEKLENQARARQAARASQEAAQHASRSQALLIQQEVERRQCEALEQARAQFLALGPMGHPAPKPDPVLQRIDELEERLTAEPEPARLTAVEIHQRMMAPFRKP